MEFLEAVRVLSAHRDYCGVLLEVPSNGWDQAFSALSSAVREAAEDRGITLSGPFPSARGPYVLARCRGPGSCERLLASLSHGIALDGCSGTIEVVPFDSDTACVSSDDERMLVSAYCFVKQEAATLIAEGALRSFSPADPESWCVDSGPVTGNIPAYEVTTILQRAMVTGMSVRLVGRCATPKPVIAEQGTHGVTMIVGELFLPSAAALRLAQAMEFLQGFLNEHAACVEYAFITLHPVGNLVAEYIAGRGMIGLDRVRARPTDLAHDAYWFQILGPGHLERLGNPPLNVIPLANGRVGVTLGESVAWATSEPELDEARHILAPLFAQ